MDAQLYPAGSNSLFDVQVLTKIKKEMENGLMAKTGKLSSLSYFKRGFNELSASYYTVDLFHKINLALS